MPKKSMQIDRKQIQLSKNFFFQTSQDLSIDPFSRNILLMPIYYLNRVWLQFALECNQEFSFRAIWDAVFISIVCCSSVNVAYIGERAYCFRNSMHPKDVTFYHAFILLISASVYFTVASCNCFDSVSLFFLSFLLLFSLSISLSLYNVGWQSLCHRPCVQTTHTRFNVKM